MPKYKNNDVLPTTSYGIMFTCKCVPNEPDCIFCLQNKRPKFYFSIKIKKVDESYLVLDNSLRRVV